MSAILALTLKSSKKSAFFLKRILDPFVCEQNRSPIGYHLNRRKSIWYNVNTCSRSSVEAPLQFKRPIIVNLDLYL